MKLHGKVLFLATAVALSGTGALHAAVVTWSAAQSVTSDTDIDTGGSLMAAAHFGTTTDYTINSVTFTGVTDLATIGSGWAVTPINTGWAAWGAGGQNGGTPIAGIGIGYQSALDACVYKPGASAQATYGFSGLTIGNTYRFQVWYNDLRDASKTMTWDSGDSTTSVALTSGNSPSSFAHYAIATFTADQTSQSFRITGNPNAGPIMNMMQLRDITTPVPEPSTYALLGTGALAGVAFLRRRNNIRRAR